MKYIEFTFITVPSNDTIQDILAGLLADAGFDSFVHSEGGKDPLKAYVKESEFCQAKLDAALSDFPMKLDSIKYESHKAEDKNWNEIWEQNYFQPLVVDNRCVIHSTFHKNVPKAEYSIVIDPRMSFGTGHHATTSQMISEILRADIKGKKVLDMGCGTSILAILARMRGASHCWAIDNDEWCVKNSLENIALNHVDNINVELGDASSLSGKGPFDLIIANINRNILLQDMKHYVPHMNKGAAILFSGFYVEDVPLIRAEAERLGLTFGHQRDMNRWACVKCMKKIILHQQGSPAK